MEKLLPSADYARLIAELLGSVSWHRSDKLKSTCLQDGPCKAHPDRGIICKDANGVAYHVFEGPLRGTWCAWGIERADQEIFEKMTSRMNVLWKSHIDDYHDIATAMRRVGR